MSGGTKQQIFDKLFMAILFILRVFIKICCEEHCLKILTWSLKSGLTFNKSTILPTRLLRLLNILYSLKTPTSLPLCAMELAFSTNIWCDQLHGRFSFEYKIYYCTYTHTCIYRLCIIGHYNPSVRITV